MRNACLSSGIPAMAFVGNDKIKCINWDVQLLGVFVDLFVTSRKDCVAAKKIDRHPLDRAHIHEGGTGLRIG